LSERFFLAAFLSALLQTSKYTHNSSLSTPNPSRPNCFGWLKEAKLPTISSSFGGVMFRCEMQRKGIVWLWRKKVGRSVVAVFQAGSVASRKLAVCMMGRGKGCVYRHYHFGRLKDSKFNFFGNSQSGATVQKSIFPSWEKFAVRMILAALVK